MDFREARTHPRLLLVDPGAGIQYREGGRRGIVAEERSVQRKDGKVKLQLTIVSDND